MPSAVPGVSLSIAAANAEVTVYPTEFIAAEQMKAAEQQRLMGIIPNFYTSYTYDTAPLTTKQKFLFAARGRFDPVAMIGVGFGAGIEQATNAYPGYGQGAAGYGKRCAAKFADGRSSDFLTHAIFPSLLHQDPRYHYQGSGSVKSRCCMPSAPHFHPHRQRAYCAAAVIEGDCHAGLACSFHRCSLTPITSSHSITDSCPRIPAARL